MAKTGRKAQHYRDPDTGVVYNGLGRRPDKNGTPGRFYAINDRNVTFGNDPKIAITKFQTHQRKTRGERPMLVFDINTAAQDIAGSGSIEVSGTNGDGEVIAPDRAMWDRVNKIGTDYERVPDELKPMILGLRAHKEQWPQYAEERGLDPELPFEGYWPDYIYWLIGRWIKTDPVDAAQKLGDPRLKNLDAIKAPKPSLRLSEIAEIYNSKVDVDPQERRLVGRFFNQFAKVAGVKTIREVQGSHVKAYRDTIIGEYEKRGLSPIWVRNRYTKVKTLLSYALKLGEDQNEITRVLLLCKMLEAPKDLSGASSRPISREDLHAILRVADARETAMTLVGLNCAFYPIDICRVPESAVDLDKGEVVFDRIKVGKPIARVAVLWQRTIKAIESYRSETPHEAVDKDGNRLVFANNYGRMLIKGRFNPLWFKLKQKAGCPGAVFSQLRDGAYTAAIEAGIDITHCEVLLGHSIGEVKDWYFKRRPQLLAPACAAIEKHYFG